MIREFYEKKRRAIILDSLSLSPCVLMEPRMM
jgi:hypothetical protein